MTIFNVNKNDSRVKVSDIVNELTNFGQVEIRNLPSEIGLKRKDLVFVPKDGPRSGEIHIIMTEFGKIGSYLNGLDFNVLMRDIIQINENNSNQKLRLAYATNLSVRPEMSMQFAMKNVKIFSNIYDVDQLKWSILEWVTYKS